jgi:hypothetical protein
MQTHSFTSVIIEARNTLVRLFSSTDMGEGMLFNHAPMRVIKATGCLDKLASFLAPWIINET